MYRQKNYSEPSISPVTNYFWEILHQSYPCNLNLNNYQSEYDLSDSCPEDPSCSMEAWEVTLYPVSHTFYSSNKQQTSSSTNERMLSLCLNQIIDRWSGISCSSSKLILSRKNSQPKLSLAFSFDLLNWPSVSNYLSCGVTVWTNSLVPGWKRCL